MRSTLIALGLLAVSTAAQAEKAQPLFDSAEPIDITITGPIRDLVRTAARSTEPYQASLSADGAELPIELSARGNSRRDPVTCKFPPLRIKFDSKPADGSLFDNQKSLKLVTHCRPSKSFERYTLLEYAAYKMYNEISDASFRVRMANVRYVDSESKKVYDERRGFFIEDVDRVADRIDMKELKREKFSVSQYDPAAAAKVVLFFHMIANHDWSMVAGPDGECCHNGKVAGRDSAATSNLVYLPYDFDYSGFVNAPYALPPETIKINSVRTRFYRGDCGQNAAVAAEAANFRAKRSAMEAAVRQTPYLPEKTATAALKFLDGFYADIGDDEKVQRLLGKCR